MTRFFCLIVFLLASLSVSSPTYAISHSEQKKHKGFGFESENFQAPLSQHDKRENPHFEHRDPYAGYKPHSDFSMKSHESVMSRDDGGNVKAPLSQHDKRWNPHLQAW